MYLNVRFPGWTKDEAAAAEKKAKTERDAKSGNPKLLGGPQKARDKAVRQILVFSIPAMEKYKFTQTSAESDTYRTISRAEDIVDEGVKKALALKKEWRTTDLLPRGYYNIEVVWHKMGHFGATNRAQVDSILEVLKEHSKYLRSELAKFETH